MSVAIAPKEQFFVLGRGARVGTASRLLSSLMLATPVGCWPQLMDLARRAERLPRNDKLAALQTYARIVEGWRGADSR